MFDWFTNFGLYLNKACTLKTWFSFLYSAHKKCGTMASELKLALSSSSVNTSSVSPNLCLASTASGTLKGERRGRLAWKHKNCASVSTCRPHSVVFMNIYTTEDSFSFPFFFSKFEHLGATLVGSCTYVSCLFVDTVSKRERTHKGNSIYRKRSRENFRSLFCVVYP